MTDEYLRKLGKVLEKARTDDLKTLSTWYSFYRLREDPFTSIVPFDEIDFFVEVDDIVEDVVYDIGVASRGIPTVTLIVAPEGFGKTTLCKHIYQVMKALSSDKRHSLKGSFYDAASLFTTDDNSEDESEGIHRWIRMSKESRDYLLLDDTKPEHLKTIMREFVSTRYKLFSFSPIHLETVLSTLTIEPHIHFLRQWDLSTTVQMLEKRIERVKTEGQDAPKLYEIFDKSSIEIIHENSFGVPRLVLDCCSKALMILRNILTNRRERHFKVTSEIALQSCRLVKCVQAKEYQNLSDTKRQVLEQVVYVEKSPTEVAAKMGKDRTTISRHLNDLKEMDLVNFSSRGREASYKATLPVRILYEMDYVPKEAK